MTPSPARLLGRVLRYTAGLLDPGDEAVEREVWRLGHVGGPLEYVPRELCTWQHRFDDPEREFRTLYCARFRRTCLEEVLGDLRPNTKARADFAQWQIAQGVASEELVQPAREVSLEWRRTHVLACATVDRDGPLIDIDRPGVRAELERRFAALLAEHGMDALRISEVRSRNRIVTQTIARDFYDRGVAGIRFRSNHDDEACIALMERRASLVPTGVAYPMTVDLPELIEFCSDYGLVLRTDVGHEAGNGHGWMP